MIDETYKPTEKELEFARGALIALEAGRSITVRGEDGRQFAEWMLAIHFAMAVAGAQGKLLDEVSGRLAVLLESPLS